MKRSILAIGMAILILGGGMLFASGLEESSDSTFERGRRGGSWFDHDDFDAPELVTVTGTLNLSDNDFPTLTSDGSVYELMVPRFYTYDLDIPERTSITVEGYLMTSETSPRMDEGENHLQVVKAIIDGEEYEIDMMNDHMGMRSDDRDNSRGRSGNSRSSRRRMPMHGGR